MTSVDDILGENDEQENEGDLPYVQGVVPQYVSVTFLMKAFRLDRSTVKKRLANLKPYKMEGANRPLYDFKEAAAYLVEPKIDIGAYLKSLRTQDLPVHLQKEYWSAMRAKQAWELAAGELWRTEDVLEVFGEAAKHIKNSIQLMVDGLDRQHGLTPEQRAAITQIADGLMADIAEKLVEMPRQRRTQSSVASLDGDGGES